VLAIPAFAQVDSLVHRTYRERWQLLHNFYSDYVMTADSAQTIRFIDSVYAAGEKAGDEALVTEAGSMKVYFAYTRMRHNRASAETIYKEFAKYLTQHPDDDALARLENVQGYWNCEVTQNFELAFEHWDKALDILRRLPDAYLDIRVTLLEVSDVHYAFADYAESIRAIKEALAVINLPPSELLLKQGNNNIGLCYQQLGQYDSSDIYFRRTYHEADSMHDDNWEAIASGNLGNNLFLRGRYDEAIPLLQLDVNKSVARSDWACASGSQTILADIMLRKNNLAQANIELGHAREYVYRSTQYKRFKPLYPLLSKYYAAIGNAKLATMYLDSSIFVSDSLGRKFNAMLLLKAQQKIDLEKREAAIAEIEDQKRLKIIERNIVVVIVIVLLVTSLYIYRIQRRKHLHRQELLNLQLKQRETELDLATVQLDNFARNISEKNNLLETFRHQFGESSNNTMLVQLQQSTILTDSEWEKFRDMFEKVHEGYLNRLKEKLPGLSPSEIRYMALAKLHLSTKEMAATLGVSKEAIRVTTHRLRRKLSLSEEGSLEELVNSI